jgi:DNA-binding transcriptional LysR family regulator
MNLKHLVYFRELAHTQHMSQAAENLGISQPTLSYAIDNLEKQLGVPLFEHEGRNIKLSRFGQIYLKFVSSGLDDIQRGNAILEQLLNVNEGNIRMAFTYTLGQKLIPELISAFKQKDESGDITFDLFQGSTPELLDGLLKEKYDFVLSSKLDSLNDNPVKGKLDFLPFIQQEIMLAVPANHPLAKANSVSVKEIADYPFIAFSHDSGMRPLTDQILENGDVKPNIAFEIEDDHTMIGFVEYGQGIALVPNLPQLDQSKVKLLHLKDNTVVHQLYMVLKDNRFLTPSVSRFQNFLTGYCKENYKQQHKLL